MIFMFVKSLIQIYTDVTLSRHVKIRIGLNWSTITVYLEFFHASCAKKIAPKYNYQSSNLCCIFIRVRNGLLWKEAHAFLAHFKRCYYNFQLLYSRYYDNRKLLFQENEKYRMKCQHIPRLLWKCVSIDCCNFSKSVKCKKSRNYNIRTAICNFLFANNRCWTLISCIYWTINKIRLLHCLILYAGAKIYFSSV